MYEFREVTNLTGVCDFYSVAKKYGNCRPFRRVLSILEHYSCKTVIEGEIKSEEEDRNGSKKIMNTRLDFFADDSVKIKTEETDIQQLIENHKSSYLGYVVIRQTKLPNENRRVAKAVVPAPKDFYPLSHFVTCGYHVPFLSEDLGTYVFPFVQKHWNGNWTCVFATLRALSFWLTESSYGKAFFEAKNCPWDFEFIDEEAERSKTNCFTAPETKIFLDQMGVESIAYSELCKENDYPVEQVAYSFLEAGFPVIFFIETETRKGHALLAIGHTFDPHSWWPDASSRYYRETIRGRDGGFSYLRSSCWTDFLVHDDNFGPYLTFSSIPGSCSRIKNAIIIFPKGRLLTPIEAEVCAFITLIQELQGVVSLRQDSYKGYSNEAKLYVENFLQDFEDGSIVLRTVFKRADDFLNSATTGRKKISDKEELCKKLAREEKIFENKEYLWITEISSTDLFAQNRFCMGEIVLDTSFVVPNDIARSVLYVHLPGLIKIYKSGRLIKKQNLFHDSPYRHFIRTSRE
jgi:hypothetical protein